MKRQICSVLVTFLALALPHGDAEAQTATLESASGPLHAEVVLSGLSEPAAIEFLPDDGALIAQRNTAELVLADFASGQSITVQGLPPIPVFGDTGLHDLELHPDYAANGWIYVSYGIGEPHRSTLVLDRIRIDGHAVRGRERLFEANAWSESESHYGGRIQFQGDYLFLSVGDRQHPEMAQERSNHVGTIVRLHHDGSVPEDNPFTDEQSGRSPPQPEIWSFGHRNPQGLFIHPETGALWSHEHGPRGGDEVNLISRGGNYGWPVTSFGFEYAGGPIGMGIVRQEGMEQPVWVYVPSIGPSDMVIYAGEAIPGWRGSFLIGAMAHTHLNRLVLREGRVVLEERLGTGVLGRVRSIALDSAGRVYLGSDSGDIWRIAPP